MTHIMVDLETLSTRYNAAILAIGAVKFSPERRCYDNFYQAVKTPPEVEGFHISSDTLHWWTQQSEKAREVFTDPDAVDITLALKGFSVWALQDTDPKDIKLWGNGASFDNAILSTAYELCDVVQPWKFYNDRCYRTVKNLNRHVELTRVGIHHNALADAKTQAEHLLDMGIDLA
jgi:hypothetical protein